MPSKEEGVMKGGPEDDLEPDDNNADDNDDNDGDDNNNEPDSEAPVTRAELQVFAEQQNRIMRMLEGVTGQQQQPQQRPTAKLDGTTIAGVSAEEFEALFWENPVAALGKYKDAILGEVRQETGKQAGQTAFWSDFYGKNADLKDDNDLVQLTLNQNISTLADMPVAEAAKKLADLTRQRILRYGGGEQKNDGTRKRTFTEGQEHRIPRQKKEEPVAPKTLGELIRARRAARRNSGKAVAT